MITVSVRGPDLAAVILAANIRIEANAEIALDTVAEATQSTAKATCPVSQDTEAHRKGTQTHMRDDILVYRQYLLRQVGTNKPYGIFVNNGTYKMKARPFLTNAFEQEKQRLIPEIQRLGA